MSNDNPKHCKSSLQKVKIFKSLSPPGDPPAIRPPANVLTARTSQIAQRRKIVGAVRKKRQGRWPIYPTVGGCPAAPRNAEATDNLPEKSESALKPLSRMPGFKVVYWWTPLSGSNNGPK
jgi:hypothetical protein